MQQNREKVECLENRHISCVLLRATWFHWSGTYKWSPWLDSINFQFFPSCLPVPRRLAHGPGCEWSVSVCCCVKVTRRDLLGEVSALESCWVAEGSGEGESGSWDKGTFGKVQQPEAHGFLLGQQDIIFWHIICSGLSRPCWGEALVCREQSPAFSILILFAFRISGWNKLLCYQTIVHFRTAEETQAEKH